jgi:citrate synthase
VVTPGSPARIHGYDVESDLARHYTFAEVTLLTLLGELPSEEQAYAFDMALTFLAPLSIAEAPTHAAALAHISGSPPTGVLGAAAIALAERARSVIADASSVLEWLAAPSAPLDPALAATTEEDRRAVERLREALARRGIEIERLQEPLTRDAALLAVLWFAGLTRREHLEAALVMASLPSVLAEAYRHEAASFRDYPMQLPPFEYVEP